MHQSLGTGTVQVAVVSKIPHNVMQTNLSQSRYNGVFTLSDTENETDTETDNKCTELNGDLCCYLSQCSVKCSACYS